MPDSPIAHLAGETAEATPSSGNVFADLGLPEWLDHLEEDQR